MRTISLFFSILLSLTAFGQPSPINRRAFALSGLATGPVPPTNSLPTLNLFWWWVASDLTNTVVTGWTDRVYHYNLITNGTTSQSPTWATNDGVTFTAASSQRLNSNGVPVTILNPGSAQWCIILKQNTSSGNRTYVSDNLDRYIVATGGKFAVGQTGPTIASGYFFDLLYAGGAGSSFKSYTNGVLYKDSTVASISLQTLYKVGCWNNGGAPTEFVDATIREILLWTNNPNFTNGNASITISNLHYYVTNTYTDITP